METTFEITFGEGKKVDAHVREFTIATDQPAADGGHNTAPTPFELFLASIGTCAGYYVLSFCRARAISTDGIRLTQTMTYRSYALVRYLDTFSSCTSLTPAMVK